MVMIIIENKVNVGVSSMLLLWVVNDPRDNLLFLWVSTNLHACCANSLKQTKTQKQKNKVSLLKINFYTASKIFYCQVKLLVF